MFSTAVLMAAIVIVAKALGLLRDILVANAYGMQSAAQAYEIASRLPIMIFDFVIGGVVSAAFIPIFSELLVKRSEKDAMRFANSYVNLIFVLTATMALLGILFSDSLVRFLAPEASSEVLSLASYLSKIMFPMIVFTGLAFSFVGILQSLGEFRIPALISLVSNSIMVAYLFFLNSFFGIVGLAVAMLLGWASQALVQVPKLRSLGYRYSPVFDFASPEIKRSLKSALPILIGTWTQPICSLINTRYASGLDNGRAITALSYSNKLYIIIVGVFTFVATNLLFSLYVEGKCIRKSGGRAPSDDLVGKNTRIHYSPHHSGHNYTCTPILRGNIRTRRLYSGGYRTHRRSAAVLCGRNAFHVGKRSSDKNILCRRQDPCSDDIVHNLDDAERHSRSISFIRYRCRRNRPDFRHSDRGKLHGKLSCNEKEPRNAVRA